MVQDTADRRADVIRGLIHRWYAGPRWAAPAAGGCILILLYALAALGVLSTPLAFTLMAALALGSLFLGLAIPDIGDEDRRSDAPIVMALTWAALFILHAGFFWPILMVLSWVGLLYAVGIVLTRDYPRWWIAGGFTAVLSLNLLLFFAIYRPDR